MHRLLAEVGNGGLEAARARLRKTPVTSIVHGNGTRLNVTRGEDGVERTELVRPRDEDLSYLGLVDAAPSVDGSEAAPARRPRVEEDLLDASPVQRFHLEDLAWLAHLDEHGYAVVCDVVHAAERSVAEDLLWQFLVEDAGMERNEVPTWSDANFARVGCIGTGIIDGAGIGQSDFLWYLRTLPAVRHVFAAIWGVAAEELLTSFDAANVFRPWQNPDLSISRTSGGWYHVDQGLCCGHARQSVQGFVSLLDADSSTGGLVVVPGSHTRHGQLVQNMASEGNFMSVPPSHPILELPKRLVSCRAGDLVLWDSRCVHCNAPGRLPDPAAPLPPMQLIRAVAYICMTPRTKASEEVLGQRREAYRDRVTTSHWPHFFNPVRDADGELKRGSGPPLDLEDEAAWNRRALVG